MISWQWREWLLQELLHIDRKIITWWWHGYFIVMIWWSPWLRAVNTVITCRYRLWWHCKIFCWCKFLNILLNFLTQDSSKMSLYFVSKGIRLFLIWYQVFYYVIQSTKSYNDSSKQLWVDLALKSQEIESRFTSDTCASHDQMTTENSCRLVGTPK